MTPGNHITLDFIKHEEAKTCLAKYLEDNGYKTINISQLTITHEGGYLFYEVVLPKITIIISDDGNLIREIDIHTIAEEFRKQYNLNHRCCPKCGSTTITQTLIGYILDVSNTGAYKDLNKTQCANCGNISTVHELVSELKYAEMKNTRSS